jgi:3-oxoacyl-[acyl-carrier-protein] synthase-3
VHEQPADPVHGVLDIRRARAAADACLVDLVAACAGLPYGMAEAIRQLQEVGRPVLLVCVEKFSDKIGSVRTSRMIFGDGAAAMVIGPAPDGDPGDVESCRPTPAGRTPRSTRSSGRTPDFDNDITVYGPEVKSLVQRYLIQMLDELGPASRSRRPRADAAREHRADRPAPGQQDDDPQPGQQGRAVRRPAVLQRRDQMGNVSAASIPIALYDAVRDGVITRRTRVFAPGFGAGAVGGYAVLRIDPAIVADEVVLDVVLQTAAPPPVAGGSSDDMRAAFGG